MSKRDRPLGQPQLRVIGGDWRGRKLSFPSKGSLRPTTDRVRETLFNWLAPIVVEAQCLDLCAGSAALGIEALSRGAQRCDFVDTDQQAIDAIEKNLRSLGATERATLRTCRADTVLTGNVQWDIVFVDPPFEAGLGNSLLNRLAASQCLQEGGLVYFETRRSAPETVPEQRYEVYREKTAGDVCFQLLRFRSA